MYDDCDEPLEVDVEELREARAEQQFDLMREDGWDSEEIARRDTHLEGEYLGPKHG